MLLSYFSCCFCLSKDIVLLQSRGAGGIALLEVGQRGGLQIWLAIPLHQSQQICPVAIGSRLPGQGWPCGGVTAGLRAPWFGFQMEPSPGWPSCCHLSVSTDTSFTDKWAAAPPYGLLMVQLPQQSSTLRAERKSCAERMGPDKGRLNTVCRAPWGFSTY